MAHVSPKVADGSHALIYPRVHDGMLLGMLIDEEGRIDLVLKDPDGQRWIFRLEGVLVFEASDFLEGNIILDVTIISGDNSRFEHLSSLSKSAYRPYSCDQVSALHEQILRENLTIVELNPSYGCHLIAVAREITVEAK